MGAAARGAAVKRGVPMFRIVTATFFLTFAAPAAEPEGDLKAFQGTWVIAEATLAGRDHLFDVLQRQGELVRIELLGSAAELHSLKLA